MNESVKGKLDELSAAVDQLGEVVGNGQALPDVVGARLLLDVDNMVARLQKATKQLKPSKKK